MAVDWSKVDYSAVDWSKVNYGGTPSTPTSSKPAPSTPTPEYVPSSPSGAPPPVLPNSGEPVGSGGAGPGFGPSNVKSALNPAAPWEYTGNIGSPPGSNIQVLDKGQDPSQYAYTNTYTNDGTQPQVINIWNSGGTTGKVGTGQSETPAKTFTLQPGESRTVAFDTDSHVGWSASPNGTNQGYTWGEASFGTAQPPGSAGWSGYNLSQINGNQGNMTMKNEVSGVSAEGAWQTGGTGANPYDRGVPPGIVRLKTGVS
ncbi:MAG TPA: hypothetical protein VFH51_18750 [Myxococcota bacterium]|nr:hypothetical protein [Myxococcota bacterium]